MPAATTVGKIVVMNGLSLGGVPFSGTRPPPWMEVKNSLDGIPPSLYADFGRGVYALNGAEKSFSDLFTISSGSKVVVGADGTLQNSPENSPAFDYSSGQRRFLLEGAATNLITRSVALELWTLNSTSVTTGGLSSDGVNNWRVLTDASTSAVGNATTSRSVPVDTASYVYSVRLKKDPSATNNMQLVISFTGGTAQNCRAVFDPRTGTVGDTLGCTAGVIDLGSECLIWQQVTNNGTNTSLINYLLPATNSAGSAGTSQSITQTGSVTVCHAQLAVGTYPSSDILTAGSQVTRVTDVCLLTSAAIGAIPTAAATVAYRGGVNSAVASQSLIGLGSGYALLRGGSTAAQVVVDGSSSAPLSLGSGLPGNIGAAFGWDASGRAGALNGAAAVSDAVAIDRSLAAFYLGGSSGMIAGTSHALAQIVAWPIKGSNAALQGQARAYA